jgi:hypothetical protein
VDIGTGPLERLTGPMERLTGPMDRLTGPMDIGTGHGAVAPEPEEPPRRLEAKWRLALAVLAATFVVLACYDLISVSGKVGADGASASSTVSPGGRHSLTPTAPTLAQVPTPGSPASSATSPAPHALTVASVAAFGPEGISDGDNPSIASGIATSAVVGGRAMQPWYSSWYATPEFGELKPAIGLLLDMGKTVTVSKVRLGLGSQLGADVQVRVGKSASLADLPVAASASDVGGVVHLPVTAPASGRYVLIWFTRLPPNSQPGEYQISVYSVIVYGTAGA